jgi:hypothetical protein
MPRFPWTMGFRNRAIPAMTTPGISLSVFLVLAFHPWPCSLAGAQPPEAAPATAGLSGGTSDDQSTTGPEPPPGVAARKGKQPLAESLADSSSIVIPGVPAYAWHHGCGPTSLGMVLGYYDSQGYGDLFAGDAAGQTDAVNQGIASSRPEDAGHYEDYSLPIDSPPTLLADKSEDPPGAAHAHDCIADFMQTSWSARTNYYGWTWSSRVKPAFTNYVQLRNPAYRVATTEYLMSSGTLTWEVVTNEISRNRPMVFLVDTDGDGLTDHFVTTVGVRENPERQYGCLDTWVPYDEIRWSAFENIANHVPWSIARGWSFVFEPPSLPPAIEEFSCSASNASLRIVNLRIGATNRIQRATILAPGDWTNASVFVSTTDSSNRTESCNPSWERIFYRVVSP